MVNCPYIGKCLSEGTCCYHCGNNKDLKEDYFTPRRRRPYYFPYDPYTPCRFHDQTIPGATPKNYFIFK